MKTTIAAIILAAATQAHADIEIPRPDGRIILQEDTACRYGGSLASYITNIGGAYGCYWRKGKEVTIRWYVHMFNTGTRMQVDRTETYHLN